MSYVYEKNHWVWRNVVVYTARVERDDDFSAIERREMRDWIVENCPSGLDDGLFFAPLRVGSYLKAEFWSFKDALAFLLRWD